MNTTIDRPKADSVAIMTADGINNGAYAVYRVRGEMPKRFTHKGVPYKVVRRVTVRDLCIVGLVEVAVAFRPKSKLPHVILEGRR